MKKNNWLKVWCLLMGLAMVLSLITVAPSDAAKLAKKRQIRELRFPAYSPGTHKMWHESQKFMAK